MDGSERADIECPGEKTREERNVPFGCRARKKMAPVPRKLAGAPTIRSGAPSPSRSPATAMADPNSILERPGEGILTCLVIIGRC